MQLQLVMGQTIISDQSSRLSLTAPSPNVSQTRTYVQLLTFKSLEVPFFEKIFEFENYKKIEVTYKFFTNIVVHLEINKEQAKVQAGCPLNIGNQVVYGYKFKKNDKYDRIRPDKIYFRRKIFSSYFQPSPSRSTHRQKLRSHTKSRSKRKESTRQPTKCTKYSLSQAKEELLHKLAELKLLSKLEVGAKMARIIDGADGILTDNYIEFYSEVPIEKSEFEKKQPTQKDKLVNILRNKNFIVKPEMIEMAYSVFQKKYILKQTKVVKKEEQFNKENRGIKYMVRACQDQINFIVCRLDGMTNMMSAIQNHLNYREIDKAMEKFQENMATMQQMERLEYAEQMVLMLSKYKYYRTYERDVSSFISQSRTSSISESKNLSTSRFDRRLKSEDSSNDSMGSSIASFRSSRQSPQYESRNPISPVSMSPRSTAPYRFSDTQSSRHFYTPERQFSSENHPIRQGSKQPYNNMWQTALERLRNAIDENDKTLMQQSLLCLKNLKVVAPLQTDAIYGRLLMENGKTKYAKLIFERLLYLKKSSRDAFICSQIQAMIAYIYHFRGEQILALKHYEKALNEKFKLRNYSRKTVIIFNNMAVLEFYLEQYEKSLLWLHRGFRLGQYCADYQLVMRSNYAMILAQKGQVKEAKMEMYKSNKTVEPYSNMEILCKFHSNLGYLQLLENIFDKAKTNFEIACQIENKYLLTSNYKPSIFLHNNFAIYHCKHHKKSQWKKAAQHLMKIESQLSELTGLMAVQIHFNFGKVLKEDYKLDQAVNHFFQCRNILYKLKESYTTRYIDKVEQEIERIQAQRIDEESEESSYINKWSRVSKKSHISNRQRSKSNIKS